MNGCTGFPVLTDAVYPLNSLNHYSLNPEYNHNHTESLAKHLGINNPWISVFHDVPNAIVRLEDPGPTEKPGLVFSRYFSALVSRILLSHWAYLFLSTMSALLRSFSLLSVKKADCLSKCTTNILYMKNPISQISTLTNSEAIPSFSIAQLYLSAYINILIVGVRLGCA